MLNPILIIGGSKRYRPLFAALKDLGIEIKQVPSAQEGVAALDLKPYDAVVMEWDLSFSNPLEIVERIKKTRPKVPVLALGSGPDTGMEKDGQAGELVEYIPMTGVENIDLARLLGSLKQVLPALRTWVLPGKDLLWIKTRNEKMIKLLALVDIIKD